MRRQISPTSVTLSSRNFPNRMVGEFVGAEYLVKTRGYCCVLTVGVKQYCQFQSNRHFIGFGLRMDTVWYYSSYGMVSSAIKRVVSLLKRTMYSFYFSSRAL